MPTPWDLDAIQVESTPLSTTGGHTWKAAYHLADFLAAVATSQSPPPPPPNTSTTTTTPPPPLSHLLIAPDIRILELGSGCGWLGLTTAHNLPTASRIVLTEQEGGGACEWLAHNVLLHTSSSPRLKDRVHVVPCDWIEYSNSNASTPLPLTSERWDFIIGSDLIYNTVGSRLLPRVLRNLMHAETIVLYCHTKHRFDLLDMEFFDTLTKECGLVCEEVWAGGGGGGGERVEGWEPPPPSPPLEFPPVDLFPEQRLAVYQIRM